MTEQTKSRIKTQLKLGRRLGFICHWLSIYFSPPFEWLTVYTHYLFKNYAAELVLLRHQGNLYWPSGMNFHVECQWSNKKQDHSPEFYIHLVLLNWMIFEFNFYSVHHVDAGWPPLDNKPDDFNKGWNFEFPKIKDPVEEEYDPDATP